MKLIKGVKSMSSENVVTGDFSLSGSPHFYARTFYELPVPGLVVEAFGDFHITDANRLVIAELAMSPLKVIGEKFTDIFSSTVTVPALLGLADVPIDLNDNRPLLKGVSLIPGESAKTFELFGINSMDVKGACYLILLLRPVR